jgi:hypothetical protein
VDIQLAAVSVLLALNIASHSMASLMTSQPSFLVDVVELLKHYPVLSPDTLVVGLTLSGQIIQDRTYQRTFTSLLGISTPSGLVQTLVRQALSHKDTGRSLSDDIKPPTPPATDASGAAASASPATAMAVDDTSAASSSSASSSSSSSSGASGEGSMSWVKPQVATAVLVFYNQCVQTLQHTSALAHVGKYNHFVHASYAVFD